MPEWTMLRPESKLYESKQPGNILVFVPTDFDTVAFSITLRGDMDDLEALPLRSSPWVSCLVRVPRQSYSRKCFVAKALAEANQITEEIRWVIGMNLSFLCFILPRGS